MIETRYYHAPRFGGTYRGGIPNGVQLARVELKGGEVFQAQGSPTNLDRLEMSWGIKSLKRGEIDELINPTPPRMPTCETCMFWEHIKDGYGQCATILDDTTGQSADGAVIFVDTMEDDDYARLTTRRDFGCTLHQKDKWA